MNERKPQSWYIWPIMIAITAGVIAVTCAIVSELPYYDSEYIPNFVGMILSTAFGTAALVLVVRLVKAPFLSEHWESTALGAVLATIAFVAVAGKSSWGAGLGLGLIGVAVVAIRYIVSRVSEESS